MVETWDGKTSQTGGNGCASKVTLIVVTVLTFVASVVLAAPAQANHGSASIVNNAYSKTYILVDVECYSGALSTNTHRIYPGASTDYYDHGFVVPKGHYYDLWRGTTKVFSNVWSNGKAVCTNSTSLYNVRVLT